ncbi:hypothetical protein OG203_45040 [Nocardia sp. NBC_01499]|uniref:hypothetical protein n=1 Tax=Nocardia sp. NBC_01499 TaxID=2903597 RepID=UPI003864449C
MVDGSVVVGGSATGVESNGSAMGAVSDGPAGGVESDGSAGVESNGTIGGSSAVVSPPGVLDPPGAALSVVFGTAGTRSADWSLVGSGRLIDNADRFSGVSGRAAVCAADPEISNPATTTNDPVIGPDLRIVRAARHHSPTTA